MPEAIPDDSSGRKEAVGRAAIHIGGEPLTLRRAGADELVDLRHAVLRQGLPRSEAIFDGDDAESSRHYAAVHSGQVVGCATLHANRWEGSPAWQLRGMATAAGWRGRGIGRALLRYVEMDVLDTSPVRLMWCNARVPAAAFYQSLGWTIRSEVFFIPTAGPHYRMTRELS